MSDTMLHAVLLMPPDLWSDSPIDVAQRHGRYIQASRRIESDAETIDDLIDALTVMLRQFTKTPSTLQDSEARAKAHAAIERAQEKIHEHR